MNEPITLSREGTRLSMPIEASPRGEGAVRGAVVERQAEFGAALSRAREAGFGKGDEGEAARIEARRAAEDFIAATFIEPLFKKMRETSDAAPPFAPGPAEKQFRGIADAMVARQVARASRFPLVDRLARDLLREPRSVPAAEPAPPTLPEIPHGTTAE